MPRKVDSDSRRASMAAAAAKLIAESGIEGAKLRDVAAAAGWTTGALTHYFPDKRDLLLMAMQSSLDHLQGKHVEALTPDTDELRLLLETALPLDKDRVGHWRVSLTMQMQSWADPEMSAALKKALRRWRRRIATLLVERIASGGFRADLDPEHTADRLIALVNGVAIQAMYDPERWPKRKQLAFLDEFLADLSA
jgi:AcrR family transcriptional regulator